MRHMNGAASSLDTGRIGVPHVGCYMVTVCAQHSLGLHTSQENQWQQLYSMVTVCQCV